MSYYKLYYTDKKYYLYYVVNGRSQVKAFFNRVVANGFIKTLRRGNYGTVQGMGDDHATA